MFGFVYLIELKGKELISFYVKKLLITKRLIKQEGSAHPFIESIMENSNVSPL